MSNTLGYPPYPKLIKLMILNQSLGQQLGAVVSVCWPGKPAAPLGLWAYKNTSS